MSPAKSSTELLREFTKATGFTVTMRPFERVLRYRIDDNAVAISIETYRYTETRYEIRFTGRGTRIVSFVNGHPESTTFWDDDFKPFVQRISGRVLTGNQHAKQVEYERDCYRPGTARVPLDNYVRVKAGASTPKMERYW